MHNFTWRLDIDLNGANGNSAYWTNHSEAYGSPFDCQDEKVLISIEASPCGTQSISIHWRSATVAEKRQWASTSYDLVPMRSGTARHYESFIKDRLLGHPV